MGNKAVSAEEIVAALLESGTIEKAAQKVGISVRTLYERMHEDSDLITLWAETRTDVLRATVTNINQRLAQAVDTIGKILEDENNAPGLRLQAAQIILNHAGKIAERLRGEEKSTSWIHSVNKRTRF